MSDLCLLAIRKTYPHQARRVAAAIWGWEPLMTAKVIVDRRCRRRCARPAASLVAGRHARPSGPRCVLPQRPGDSADHAAPVAGIGHAMAIDATAKLPGGASAPWPAATEMPKTVRDLVRSRWRQYGLPPLDSRSVMNGTACGYNSRPASGLIRRLRQIFADWIRESAN